MSKLLLRRLGLQDEKAFLEAIAQWDQHKSFHFLLHYKPEFSFAAYLENLDAYARGERLAPGFVPDTSLFGFDGEKIVGRLTIRHQLNDHLLKVGGHIGYGVLPAARGRGHATEMLKQALPIAQSLGLEKVLLTCDDNNEGSIKTIEKNGGMLENKVATTPEQPLKRRYWIPLK